jgi:uroporphyrinogen decarboxylase
MKAYRDLVKEYPTFRQRSEIPEVALEISLQPFEAYGVDGVILFSDILTPLPEMGIDFSIGEGGNISIDPIRTMNDFKQRMKRTKNYNNSCSGQVLRGLREKVGNRSTVLGFIGLPYTIGTYLVEGKTALASGFVEMNGMQKENPELLHKILGMLADNLADYACYQIDNGAQVLQVFDSWAGHLNDQDYKTFAIQYQQKVIRSIKSRHPETPIIIYIAPEKYSRAGQRLVQLAKSGADIVSVDHTVDMAEANIILQQNGVRVLQGNLNPELLRDGSMEDIQQETRRIIEKTKGIGNIMNLGHGILPDTPEDHAAFFVKTVQEYRN